MSSPQCFVCGDRATVSLGIRGRYENTNAVWAPNLDAHLCGEHAKSGCDIEIVFRPTTDGHVHVRTKLQDGPLVSVINHPIGKAPQAAGLF